MKLPRILGLQRRIMTYVAVGLLALFALLAALTWRAIQQSSALIAEQRLSLAGTLAMHLDATLQRALADIQGVSHTLNLLGDGAPSSAAVLDQLRERLTLRGEMSVLRCIAVVDAAGRVWVAEAAAAAGTCDLPAAGDLALRALGAGQQVWDVSATARSGEAPLVRVATLVGERKGTEGAALVVYLRPTLHSAALQSVLSEAASRRGYQVELLAEGRAVDTSVPEPPAYAAAHWRLIESEVRLGRAGLVQHRLSRPGGNRGHFIAYVPLQVVPWVIVVEQPFDLAVALPYALRDQMLTAGALGLLVALAAAWITTRQVIRPLSALSAAARDIARGDLDQPIRPAGHDEVHALGTTLEGMRRRLKVLLEEREEWGRELERQVAARTRELELRNEELGAAGAENRRLYEQVAEKERQRRRLLELTMSAYEEERKRVARELHDEVGQALTGLIMTLDTLTARDSKPRVQRQALLGLRDLTSTTLSEVRRMISALRPSLLDDLGLVPAIQSYAKMTLGAVGLDYRIETPAPDVRVSATVETALYRITQEAINNVVRHAHAEHVFIGLEIDRQRATLEVRDDGAGFDAGAVISNGHTAGTERHVGLLGMRERAELLGGRFEIKSASGKGTRVCASVPVCVESERSD